jgi:hypothetical protein
MLVQVTRLDSQGLGDESSQGDRESSPQLWGPPLPDDVRGIVVALPAQGLAESKVSRPVSLHAGHRATVRACRLPPRARVAPPRAIPHPVDAAE